MFKDHLKTKSKDKGKQIEQESKIDKELVQLKYEGNQKRLGLNAGLDSNLESTEIESEIEPNLERIKKLSQEARQLICKRQKSIKIADKSKDGWQVVAEHESDELVSSCEDEKRLEKAKEALSRKKRQKEQVTSDRGKKARLGAANQLFRDKKLGLSIDFVSSHGFGSACISYHIPCIVRLYYGNLIVKYFRFV